MLELPPNFANDIQGKDTALVPVVLINTWGSQSIVGLSINHYQVPGSTLIYKPLLLNIPSLKESIDIETRNYKISSVNIDISNFPYNGKRFSDTISEDFGSFINTEVRIFWASPSGGKIRKQDHYPMQEDDALQIYFGTIRRYTHDDEKVRLVVEDRSQATLHTDLPLPVNYLTGDDVPDKYKNKPIPMVYGHVDRSPCVISKTPSVDEWGIDAGNIDVLIDRNDSGSKLSGISPLLLYINGNWVNVPIDVDADIPDQNTYDILGYSQNTVQYTFANNIIQLQSYINPDDDDDRSPISDNRIVGYEFLKSGMTITPLQARSTYWSASHENRAWYTTLGIDSSNSSFEKNGILMGSLLREPGDGDWSGSSYLYAIEGTSDDITCCEAFYGDPGRDDKHEETFVGCRITTGAIDSSSFESVQGLLYYKIKVNIGNANTWDGGVYNFIQLRVGGSYESRRHEFYTNYGALSGASWQTPNNSLIENVFNIEEDTDSLLIYLRLDDGAGASLGRMAAKFEIQDLYLHNYLLIKDAIDKDFYANVNGRAMQTWETSTQTYYYDPTAPQVIAHILNNELGQSGIDPTGTYDWQYAFTVDKKINSKKLIEGIASASPYLPRFTNMGDFVFTEIPMDGGTVPEGNTIKEADCIEWTFSRTKIEDVYTKIQFFYNWDYARGEFQSSVEVEVGEGEGIIAEYSFDYYGFEDDHSESTLIIDDDRGKYIRVEYTAQDFADWYLMWSCNQHLKMKIKLPLKYMNLEIGDFVDFDAILGGVKPYGIDYINDGEGINSQEVFKNFLITSTNKTLEFCQIECIQMHNLGLLQYIDTIFNADEYYDVIASPELNEVLLENLYGLFPELGNLISISQITTPWDAAMYDEGVWTGGLEELVGGDTYNIKFSQETTTNLFQLIND